MTLAVAVDIAEELGQDCLLVLCGGATVEVSFLVFVYFCLGAILLLPLHKHILCVDLLVFVKALRELLLIGAHSFKRLLKLDSENL